jgi:hypothetical protein
MVSASLQNAFQDPEKYFVVPICLACDETKLKGKGKQAAGHSYVPLLYLTKYFATSLPLGALFGILGYQNY